MNEDEALRCLEIANAAIRVSDWPKVTILINLEHHNIIG